MRLVIDKIEDRGILASILVRNGYAVKPGKARRTPTGKSVDYYIDVEKSELMNTEKKKDDN